MMTETQIENAARQLCRLRGVDPEEIVSFSNGTMPLIASHAPAWRRAAKEIIDFEQIETAINFGKSW